MLSYLNCHIASKVNVALKKLQLKYCATMLKIMLHQGLEIDNFSGVHITFKQSVNQIILSHFFFHFA